MIFRKALVVLGGVVLAALPLEALAGSKTASCLLVVNGFQAIRGPCKFELVDPDGSFEILALNGKYFAYVFVTKKGLAEGHWNAEPYAGHAHTSLGTLTRDGACWANDTASVCAY